MRIRTLGQGSASSLRRTVAAAITSEANASAELTFLVRDAQAPVYSQSPLGFDEGL